MRKEGTPKFAEGDAGYRISDEVWSGARGHDQTPARDGRHSYRNVGKLGEKGGVVDDGLRI